MARKRINRDTLKYIIRRRVKRLQCHICGTWIKPQDLDFIRTREDRSGRHHFKLTDPAGHVLLEDVTVDIADHDDVQAREPWERPDDEDPNPDGDPDRRTAPTR